MRWRLFQFAIALAFLMAYSASAQSNEQEGPVPVQRIPVDNSASRPKDNRNSPPRSDTHQVNPDESSSKDSQIDVSPPKGDEKHVGASDEELGEFHPWDPHKATKCIEVGDYYYKQENYRAAISRYQEALGWKPRDAEATYKLGQVLEKTGDFSGALENYQAYLKILPVGPYAPKARQGIERVKPKANTAAQAAPKPS
jgi:tetratricopeptide (TPR) repeat protein